MSGENGTLVVGLLGWPVQHSCSPAMHNAAAAALGLDLIYVPLATAPHLLANAVRGLPALGFRGANVTVPHKQSVMSLLDNIDPVARAIGAVNTILVEPDGPEQGGRQRQRLFGFNTDWSGFLADLAMQGVSVQGEVCFVLGAGGSARAIAYGLARSGAQVHLYARRREQAEQLVSTLGAQLPGAHLHAHSWKEAFYERFTPRLIVNTTPVGMAPATNQSPWPADVLFPAKAFVYDLVYNPRETLLLRQARASGCRAVNGLGMLVQQGAQAFAMWTGIQPDTQVMLAAVT